ncbi:MAG: SAM domain-containing protein [Pseudomonadota bacterium]
MTTFEDWLGRLGLADVAPRLEAHGVGWQTLPELSDADLRALGLTDGQRRRLRQAIDDLAGVARVAELGLAEEAAPSPSIGDLGTRSTEEER